MIRAAIILLACLASPSWADTKVPTNRAEIQLGFAPLVKAAAPAVVNIYAKRVVDIASSPFDGDPFFQNMFRGFGKPRPRVQNSLGSGVILTPGGILVSNHHVVRGATDIRVVLNDRTEYSAHVLLADEDSDLSILQLDDAENMPYLELRDSETVEVGELVLAIGNPFGVGQTVTSGIVSGLARSGVATGGARGYFIQTDAAINPGNSGGALIDVNGALIGINTRIVTRSGGSNGIGFAIPSSLVAQFVQQADAGAITFNRPWAGMSGQPVDGDIAESLGLPRPGGILVSDLHAISPFLAADFRAGDVILSVNGQPVNTPEEMVYRMSVAGLGNAAIISRFRDGKSDDVAVDLIAAPNTPPRKTIRIKASDPLGELEISNVNPAVLAEFGLPLGAAGVVVSDPGPIGARIGLRAGDILREINGETVENTAQAAREISDARRKMSLIVQRGTQRIQMRFRL